MLFRAGKNWLFDLFVRRGWLMRHQPTSRPVRSRVRPAIAAAECLEERTLLSTITVTSLADNLTANGQVTLREALQAANTDASVDGSVAGQVGGQDQIVFQAGLSGTIVLDAALGQLTISSSVRIQGLGAANTILDAQQHSRILNITGAAGAVTLDGLTLTNGSTTGIGDSGSAIANGLGALSSGTLTISNSTISGNSSLGADANGAVYSYGPVIATNSTFSLNFAQFRGGAIFSKDAVTVVDSILSDNQAAAATGAGGGAIYSGSEGVTITNCTIEGNSTTTGGAGGAVWSLDDVTITDSVLSGNFTFAGGEGGAVYADKRAVLTVVGSTFVGNSTYGADDPGGAIRGGTVTITNSTLTGNTTVGQLSHGGAIDAQRLTLTNSTVSNNSALGKKSDGGAIYVRGELTVTNSSIVDNRSVRSVGGGINAAGKLGTQVLRNSIVARNTDIGTAPDLKPHAGTAPLFVTNSLIGNNLGTVLIAAPIGSPDANGNLIGTNAAPIDPQLGALADNGGLTQTRQPLVGSPVINKGSNAAASDPGPDLIPGNVDDVPLTTDQRGAGFARIAGTVDMGAFEVQADTLAQPTVNPLVATSSTPVLTGTWDEKISTFLLQVTVAGTTFTLGIDPQLTTDGAGHWTLTPTVAIPDGTYSVLVHTASVGGSVSDDNTNNELTIDTVPPGTPTVNSLLTTNATPTITGTWNRAGATLLQVTLNGTTYTLGSSAPLTSVGDNWTLNLSGQPPLPSATYDVLVHTADAAGNIHDDATAGELTVDNLPPEIPTVTQQLTNDQTPIIAGTWDFAGATLLQVTIVGTTYTLGTNPQLTTGGSTWTLNLAGTPPLASGTYDIAVHTADAVGNIRDDVTTNELTVSPLAVPTVSLSRSVATFAEAGGTVTITVSLSLTSATDTTVNLGYTGSATSGVDYTGAVTLIVVPSGSPSVAILLTSVPDTIDEQQKTIVVDITGVTNGTENGTQQVTSEIVDDDAPTSRVLPLPATTGPASFTVTWEGSAGVSRYNVFASDNRGPWTSFVTNSDQTSAVFNGQIGHNYEFYSVATDVDGMVQATPAGPQAVTFAGDPPAFSRQAGLEGFYYVGTGLAQVLRNDNTLKFIDPNGVTSAGTVNGTQVVATDWNNLQGVFDQAAGTISFADGTLWQSLRQIDGRLFTGTNLVAGVQQLGTELTFTGGTGAKSTGRFINPLQVIATDWNVVGTLTRQGTEIRWSNNTIWTVLPAVDGPWSNALGNAVRIEQSGAQLLLVNRIGQTATAQFTAPNQFVATGWGNLAGTLIGRTVQWNNGTAWTFDPITGPNPDLGGVYDVLGQDTRILQNNNGMTLVNRVGGTSAAHFASPTQIVADDWGGVVGNIVGTTIVWPANTWSRLPDVGGTYFNQTNKEEGINQVERSLTFTSDSGVVTHGKFTSPTQILETDGQQRTGTFSGKVLTWSNGTVWTQLPDLRANWSIASNDAPTYIEQSGVSVLFVGNDGVILKGVFASPTQLQLKQINISNPPTVNVDVTNSQLLDFGAGLTWKKSALTALDAVYADTNLWPFL